MPEFVLVPPTALLLDFIFGTPDVRLHPLQIILRSADGGRRLLNKSGIYGWPAGLILIVLFVLGFGGLYTGFLFLLARFAPPSVSIVFNGFLLYTTLSFRSRFTNVLDVIPPLRDEELEEARSAAKPFLKRDVEFLDLPDIARGCVERFTVDALFFLVAPLFWYLAGGAIGFFLPVPVTAAAVGSSLLYRIANSSSTRLYRPGLRSEGTGSLPFVLDRILSIPPALLSLPILFVSAIFAGGDVKNGVRILLRDRRKHLLPDSGMYLNFIAGAFHLRMGGPTIYPSGMEEKPWIGEGTAGASVVHIKQSIRTFLFAGLFTYIITITIAVIFWNLLGPV